MAPGKRRAYGLGTGLFFSPHPGQLAGSVPFVQRGAWVLGTVQRVHQELASNPSIFRLALFLHPTGYHLLLNLGEQRCRYLRRIDSDVLSSYAYPEYGSEGCGRVLLLKILQRVGGRSNPPPRASRRWGKTRRASAVRGAWRVRYVTGDANPRRKNPHRIPRRERV